MRPSGEHIARRESPLGRWLPVVFYSTNVTLWMLTSVMFQAWDLLYLGILTIPALALYLWRTG